MAERFEFIHPHWKRLVWSLLFEQSNPTDQSLKWRRKRETDQSVRSGFAYFDDPSQVTCCEPTRLKLRKNPNPQNTQSVLQSLIYKYELLRSLQCCLQSSWKKINLIFPQTNIQIRCYCGFSLPQYALYPTMSRGKSKLLLCCVKMVINPEYTKKSPEILLMALFHPTVTCGVIWSSLPTPPLR